MTPKKLEVEGQDREAERRVQAGVVMDAELQTRPQEGAPLELFQRLIAALLTGARTQENAQVQGRLGNRHEGCQREVQEDVPAGLLQRAFIGQRDEDRFLEVKMEIGEHRVMSW